MKALALRVEDRYPTADDLRQGLMAVAPTRFTRRRRVIQIIAGAPGMGVRATASAGQGRAALGHAYLAIARKDTTEALQRFGEVADSACPDCYFARLSEAELSVGRRLHLAGRPGARRWFTFPPRPYPLEVAWSLLQARDAEVNKTLNTAAECYCAVAAVWSSADSALGGYVAQADQGSSVSSVNPCGAMH